MQVWKDFVRSGFVGSVGKTPLVRLQTLSEETGCNILVKNEAANPGGSVKDRAALFLIMDAEEKGMRVGAVPRLPPHLSLSPRPQAPRPPIFISCSFD